MKTFVTSLLLVTAAIQSVYAQEQSSEDLLKKIESKVQSYSDKVSAQENNIVLPVSGIKPSQTATPLPVVARKAPPMPAINMALEEKEVVSEKGGIDIVGDQNLMIPLRELPTGSRFTFNKTIFFPANTVSLVYVNGNPQSKVYKGGDPLDSILSSDNIHHSACVISTDKSYIKLRGSDSATSPTFIDFDKIEYIQDGESERIVFRLSFMPKETGNHNISISMSCVLPEGKNADVSNLTMQHLVDAFGQSFTFEVPKYVEL